MIPTLWHSGKDKTLEATEGSVVARGWGKGRRGGAQRIFELSESTLYSTLAAHSSHLRETLHRK